MARNSQQLADLGERYGDQVRAVTLDVTDARAASDATRTTIDAFGRIDVLVNNAGCGDVGSIEHTNIADFRAQIETNLLGVVNLTKAAIPLMREQRSDHIIQLSSIGGWIRPPGRAGYSTAKSGVEGFSEVLAAEVGPLGIKLTIVEPGAFRTDFAGSSTKIREGRPEYDSTVGAMACYSATITAPRLEILLRPQPSLSISPVSMNHRCDCSSEVPPCLRLNKANLHGWKAIASGGN
jgi:NAD(P)-dependent dehydrogenase (short-subunit alcohol dehydrogenase family)